MSRIDRRFHERKTPEDLGRAIDEHLFRNRYGELLLLAKYSNSWGTQAVDGPSGLGVGELVQIRDGGRVIRAGASDNIICTDVVIDVLEAGRYVIAPFAIVPYNFATPPANLQTLYLGDYAKPTTTKPSAGLIQRVGHLVSHEAEKDQYLCRFVCLPIVDLFIGS